VTRYVRAPDLLLAWRGKRLYVEDLHRGRATLAGPDLVVLLDQFGRPRTPESLARALPGYEPKSLLRAVRQLRARGFLLTEAEARRRRSRIEAWRWNLASALYHVASRDLRYLSRPGEIDLFLRREVATKARPRRFKSYPGALRVSLPRASFPRPDAGLDQTLLARRTARRFARHPVALEDFAAVLRGTFARTGTLDGGVLGALSLKTSPSAGALHPIEAYAIVHRVEGLRPGLYHYEVARDELRRLRAGDLRATAVRAASGQAWVGGAAFVCVLTAVFARTLWKYGLESAYRTLWLDAGHLGQTFCLLATARGLGPFVTAAIQDSVLERLLELDSRREFPVYLLGAGALPRPDRR
jgi:SagB-type dehydrogenase family enzyme